ncbi:MAG: YicC family protein [Clostridia bacterium]|nr:YicC family protein [Clostridia bacterium]
MINSMTGFGRAQRTAAGKTFTVEVKSVNHRYFDCTVKVPRAWSYAEEPLKALLAGRISRGKCEIYLSVDSHGSDVAVVLNRSVADSYLLALRELRETCNLKDDISVMSVARLPDVFTVTAAAEDAEETLAAILSVASEAVDAFCDMRRTEGVRLAEDILGRTADLRRMVAAVEEQSPQVVAQYREKLETRIREILGGAVVDEGRLLTEAALFADKTAVDEETVRLRSHLDQLDEMLRSDAAVGRKLDFLVQEINRETNTIGSKCNDLTIGQTVVDMKAEIEKIREQVQNIE